MAPTKHFNDIPLELRRKIISYIVRPLDLRMLCLTSQSFRELATPLLYRKFTLFIGGPGDVHISAMLSRTNPGVQHIRKIYLQLEKIVVSHSSDSDSSEDSSEGEDHVRFEEPKVAARQAQFTVRLLLDFLPNDILENFRYSSPLVYPVGQTLPCLNSFHEDYFLLLSICSKVKQAPVLTQCSWQNWEPFSIDNWILLCKKQKRLKAVEIASVDRPYMPVIEKQPELLKDLTDVNSLHFYPENLDRLHACQKVLEAHPQAHEMQLSPGFQFAMTPPPPDLHDSSTRPGLLFRTIFSHLLPLETCTPLKLTKMTMDNIDVRYAADTYMKAIDFSCLESFVIGGCAGADAVFSQMSKPHIRPSRLKKLRWFHEETAEPHALEAFEGLLEGLNGLEILHVDLNSIGGLPKPSAITNHRRTLRVLAIRSRMGPPELPQLDSLKCYEQAQFDEICTQCTELRQLSITTPETFVSNPRESPEFKDFLRCAAKLPYLVTLNLQRWPQTTSPFISNYNKLKPRALELYRHHLQRLAQNIFTISDTYHLSQGWGLGHRSHLSVLAFGGNGSTPYDEAKSVKLKQMPYVRGTKIDPFGNREMCAVRILWKEVGWVEGESDMLNHSMYDLEDVHHTPT